MNIEDLFWLRERREFAAKPEMDPLTEDISLMESELVDVRFEALTSTVGLLFDLRGALQLRSANTGVLIVHGVVSFDWRVDFETFRQPTNEAFLDETRPYLAWTVIASEPQPTDTFNLKLQFVPSAELNISGVSAEFFMGDVPGIGEVAATYTDDSDEEIEASLPHWDSPMEVYFATFLDRKDSRQGDHS